MHAMSQWRIQHECYGCFSTRNIGTIYQSPPFNARNIGTIFYCHHPQFKSPKYAPATVHIDAFNLVCFVDFFRLISVLMISKIISYPSHLLIRWNITTGVAPKGQLISKCIFGIFNSSRNQTKKFALYGTSSRIVFICFMEEFEDTKKTF